MSPRARTLTTAALCFLLVWLLAWGGYALAKNSRHTAAKVQRFMSETDLKRLSGEKRAKALRELAEKIARLDAEERRKFRGGVFMEEWFNEMTEEEKGAFLEATMPSGFKQMIAAFEQLPDDKRLKAVNDAMKRLRESPPEDADAAVPSEKPPALSEDLQNKVATIGLKSFYSQSSAKTKAEMAPLLEEIQKNMENGRMFR